MKISKDKKLLLLYRLKFINAFRVLFYPYMKYKRKRLLRNYYECGYGDRLLPLKNKFDGKRCFIIGNGPSLTPEDLDKVKNEYTFATNKIFYIFDRTSWRPTFYCCMDMNAFEMLEDKIALSDTEYKFLNARTHQKFNQDDKFDKTIYYLLNCLENKIYLNVKKRALDEPVVSENVNEFVYQNGTVTFTAIQLAFFMGFKEIYLLGIDHNYPLTRMASGKIISNENKNESYFEGMPKTDYQPGYSFYTATKCYQAARSYADAHGIKIINATRGGKLEVFERADFDSLFESTEEN
ncbi:MAG: DUF115 domain-containing protein [Lachnospiraceae bacterium]|nr:DUF115 domain-containing protein [Lachnospiraceae bacterium]